MSNVINIQEFFVGKTFVIPPYQREYAWTKTQVDDMLEDIAEAITTQSPHYLGTVVLSQNGPGSFDIVDGQQRLTTLTLIMHALLEELPPDDQQRIADTVILLRQDNDLKIHFGNNATFVDHLFEGAEQIPETGGQRRLLQAYKYARERAKVLSSNGGLQLIQQWLEKLKTLEIIQFVAEDTGRAIRMFQTVNDRGLPLHAMDKAKALLVFYSNRYLDGTLDTRIHECFGSCYVAFDGIREFVRKPVFRIDNIARDTFSEDDLLRYHYLSYTYPSIVDGGDYDGTIRTVFDSFLKGTLKQFAAEPTKLREFIDDYIEDLSAFCIAFREIVDLTAQNTRIYKYLVVLGVSARLYPLTIRLHQRKMLFDVLPDSNTDLLQCIETCDVRVYKTRGTDPAKDIGNISHNSRTTSAQDIAGSLQSFTTYFTPDGYFQVQLSQNIYNNRALPRMLLDYDEHCAGSENDMSTLQELVTEQITREHIVAQNPSFTIAGHGFDDEQDFDLHLHQLGNMTPLTKSENSRCSNISVHSKMTAEKYYPSSKFAGTRQLAHEYMTGMQQFQKSDIQKRTQQLSEWIIGRWPLW